ncbi:hypothetical protein ACJ72_03357 [Emergomyces africanus]|uniref:Uncharacterized protein n=1 Tax=Emergomyces africanus TaxID=1955775 RepID=A0A1B7NZT7_9EURO|nr:hypothetical protein ACJ72_03357 [Emergomyces africanus]
MSAARDIFINHEISAIPVANFGCSNIKLFTQTIIDHITLLSYETPVTTYSSNTNAAFNTIPDSSQDMNNLNDTEDSSNLFFQLNYDQKAEEFHSDVFSHYEHEYCQKIMTLLLQLKTLFSSKLDKVKNFEILILFINEKNVKDLKRVMNIILEKLHKMNCTE